MTGERGSDVYLNRRAVPRVSFRSTVRYAPDPTRPLRTRRALTQDLGARGLQLLTTTSPDRDRPLDLWIPIDSENSIAAKAHVEWIRIEDELGDSPYWIRTGFSIRVADPRHRRLLMEYVARKSRLSKDRAQELHSKISYLF